MSSPADSSPFPARFPARFPPLAWLLSLARVLWGLSSRYRPGRPGRSAENGGPDGQGGTGRDRNPWRCLRYPSMRWWSGANLVSNIGTWMQLTVQNLLVLQITGSAATTGATTAVQAAPGLLLSLLGGAFVDSLPRKVTAAVSQAALGAVALTTTALVALDMVNVPVLLTLAAITGVIATIDNPACTLLGNDLVKSKDVPSAIALGSVVHSIGRLVGAAAAGGAVAWFGLASAYAVNGASFLAVTAVIPFLTLVPKEGAESDAASPVQSLRLPRAGDRGRGGQQRRKDQVRPPERRSVEPVWRRMKPSSGAGEGLTYFVRNPRLVALTVITGISAIFGRNYHLTLAVLVTGPLAGGAGAFGTVSTVLAVGGMAGAMLAGCLRRPTVVQVGVLASAGAGLQIMAGLSPSMLLLLVLVAPMAVVESVSDTLGTTVLQTEPPPGMRGRVLGVWRSASTGWQLLGPLLLGGLMEFAGARGALITGGLVIIGLTLAGMLYQARLRGPATRSSGVPSVRESSPEYTPAV